MARHLALSILAVVTASFFSACTTTSEKPVAQTPAFGEPASTIPWNQPQKWEGGGAGFNALRNGEDN